MVTEITESERQLGEAVALATRQSETMADIVRRSQDRATGESADVRFKAMDEAAAKAAGFQDKMEVWRQIPIAARQQLAHLAASRERAAAKAHQDALADGRVTGKAVIEVDEDAFGGLLSPDAFQAYVNGQYDSDDFDMKGRPINVFMCDPPPVNADGQIVPVHPGLSRIPIMAVEQKMQQGFSRYPIYPFLPPPGLACPMSTDVVFGAAGGPCPYKGHTEDQVEQHMKAAHPSEYAARERRLQREQGESGLKSQADDRAVMRTLLEELLAERRENGREASRGRKGGA